MSFNSQPFSQEVITGQWIKLIDDIKNS